MKSRKLRAKFAGSSDFGKYVQSSISFGVESKIAGSRMQGDLSPARPELCETSSHSANYRQFRRVVQGIVKKERGNRK